MSENEIIRARLERASSITVLTGAGISTETGIPDFKSLDEDWPYEEPRDAMLSAPFWRKNPRRFWEVYRETLGATADAGRDQQPGSFHRWLVELEALERIESLTILTQNVDGLHSKAGSTTVIEAHGNSSRAVCIECKLTVPMESLDGDVLPTCPRCGLPPLKPDVSLFFEGVTGIGDFRRAIELSGLLIVAGTRLQVGPVNELPYYAQSILRPTIWIGDEYPDDFYSFTNHWIGKVEDFVEEFQL